MSLMQNNPPIFCKTKGILTHYLLYSLNKKPKSGYELIEEIKEKTKGDYIPSKGSIYPILNHLEEERLIKVKSIEKRSKSIYEVTSQGKKTLLYFKKHKTEMEKNIKKFRVLMEDAFDMKDDDLGTLFFDIKIHFDTSPSEKKDEVVKLLKKCRSVLGEK